MTDHVEHSLSVDDGLITLKVSAMSDRGRVRRVNEDSYVAYPPVFLVADGMGGHMFGDRASGATAQVFADIEPHTVTTVARVLQAVDESHRRVVDLAEQESAGTTLSGVALVTDGVGGAPRWMAFNIGDSRVYQWSMTGGLSQLSVDHSAVQELIDDGEITAEQAETHPERNVITRAIGAGDEPDPDVWLFPVEDVQIFLICSDGLSKELSDESISMLIAQHHGDPSSCATALVGAALEAGGADNVTVVMVASRFVRSPLNDEHAPTSLPAHLESTVPRKESA